MIEKLMKQIEAGDLRYDLAFASGPRSLIQRISRRPLVQQAQKLLAFDPDAAQTVLKRAKQIYSSRIEPGYWHSDDLILATYVYLLSRNASPSVGKFLNELAKGRHREFRGANGVAQIMVERMQETTMQAASGMSWATFVVSPDARRAASTQRIADFPSISLANAEDLQRYYQAAASGHCVEVV